MTNINIIEQQISAINKYLKILKGCQKYSQKKVEKDDLLKGSVERYLYLLTQETINLAEAIISLKDFRRPDTYAETFRILNEEKIISSGLTQKLVEVAKFRNIIAHDYKNIDYAIIYDVLQNGLSDIEKFVKEIKKSLNI